MDEIIGKLAEIEKRASDIMDEANEKKKDLSLQMKNRTEDWDRSLMEETEKEVAALREKMQESIQEQLAQQKQDADREILAMQDSYSRNHNRYTEQLFLQMTRE